MDRKTLLDLASELNACGDFRKGLKRCKSIEEVAAHMHSYRFGIVEHFGGNWDEPDPDFDDVVGYLKCNILDDEDVKRIVDEMGFEMADLIRFVVPTWVNAQKLRKLIKIIDDISEHEVDVLYSRHRPNSYESTLKLAI